MPATKTSPKDARLFFVWGADEDEKRRLVSRLVAARVAEEDRGLDVEYLDVTSPNFAAEAVIHAARDRAMFSERRVVVVQNAQRFRDKRTLTLQQELAEALPRLPEYATVIFVARHAEERSPGSRGPAQPELLKVIRKLGEVIACQSAKPGDLRQRAQAEAQALGKSFQDRALALFAERVTPGGGISQEVAKLAAHAGDRPQITPADVEAHLAPRPDEKLWDVLDAAALGNRARALAGLRDLLAGGDTPYRILPQIRRTLRELAQAKFLQEQGVRPNQDAEALPAQVRDALPREHNLYADARHAWKRGKKFWPQAKRFRWEQLADAFDRLCLAEAALKGWETGVADPETALEMLVIRLAER